MASAASHSSSSAVTASTAASSSASASSQTTRSHRASGAATSAWTSSFPEELELRARMLRRVVSRERQEAPQYLLVNGIETYFRLSAEERSGARKNARPGRADARSLSGECGPALGYVLRGNR